MKIKEIVLESEVTLKPLAGAQEVDIDGKAIGTATTPAAAQAISDLAKKGEFTPAADGAQPTSEEQGDSHHDDLSLARKLFHANPDLDHEQEILNAGFAIMKQQDGAKAARYYFSHDADFPSDFISDYKWLQRHQHSVYEEHPELDTIEQGGGSVGGDGTDDFIDDIVDKSFERGQSHDGTMSPFSEGMFGFGNKTPEEWAKTSPQMAKLLQFRDKAKGTQYQQQVEKRIEILKDRLDLDAGEVAGPGGAPKDPVPPEQFDMKQLRESDNALLEKMRTIAGLR
jgi:hypothetical protein